MKKIFIPDSIGIYINPKLDAEGSKGNLHLHFDEYLLGQEKNSFSIQPFTYENYKRVDCYLEPCLYENLNSGDLAFCTTSDTVYADNLSGYCVIIGAASFAYVDDMGIVQFSVANPSRFNWYKVSPLN